MTHIDLVYETMQARISVEVTRLRELMASYVPPVPPVDDDLLRAAAERNVASYMRAEREAEDEKRLRELRLELAALRQKVAGKPKQHGRDGQLRAALKELVAMGINPTKKAVAKWMGLDNTRLSKPPLSAVYEKAITKIRLKASEGRVARKKGWHEAVG